MNDKVKLKTLKVKKKEYKGIFWTHFIKMEFSFFSFLIVISAWECSAYSVNLAAGVSEEALKALPKVNPI